MPKPDLFTLKRLVKFTREFRERNAQFPTRRDFEDGGFSNEAIQAAVKEKLIEEVYATLTTGAVVKGFKVTSE